MKRICGIFLILLGLTMLYGAYRLSRSNEADAVIAEKVVLDVLPQMVEQIPKEPTTDAVARSVIPVEYLEPEDLTMTEKTIDGYSYIGYLSMPTIGRELPILADWDYDLLKKAPCRFTGTIRGNDLVLMAHNYRSHFGKLSELRLGDRLTFTDMDGVVTIYEVVAKDILDPSAVEELTAGIYDLALFTCTYGGQSRMTVYCDKIG